jgi:hypothetical protein
MAMQALVQIRDSSALLIARQNYDVHKSSCLSATQTHERWKAEGESSAVASARQGSDASSAAASTSVVVVVVIVRNESNRGRRLREKRMHQMRKRGDDDHSRAATIPPIPRDGMPNWQHGVLTHVLIQHILRR